MAAITRLGLYGGSRGLYGDFSVKTLALTGQITRLGLYGGPRGLYGNFALKQVIASEYERGRRHITNFIQPGFN